MDIASISFFHSFILLISFLAYICSGVSGRWYKEGIQTTRASTMSITLIYYSPHIVSERLKYFLITFDMPRLQNKYINKEHTSSNSQQYDASSTRMCSASFERRASSSLASLLFLMIPIDLIKGC